MFIDSAYKIPNWKIEGKIAKTNLPACTYMRGPGMHMLEPSSQ
jgi:xanthine dehydrogenase/oxidase